MSEKQPANDLKNLPLSSKILGGILAVPVTGILLIAVGLLVRRCDGHGAD